MRAQAAKRMGERAQATAVNAVAIIAVQRRVAGCAPAEASGRDVSVSVRCHRTVQLGSGGGNIRSERCHHGRSRRAVRNGQTQSLFILTATIRIRVAIGVCPAGRD